MDWEIAKSYFFFSEQKKRIAKICPSMELSLPGSPTQRL
jgi:hypothetical protein